MTCAGKSRRWDRETPRPRSTTITCRRKTDRNGEIGRPCLCLCRDTVGAECASSRPGPEDPGSDRAASTQAGTDGNRRGTGLRLHAGSGQARRDGKGTGPRLALGAVAIQRRCYSKVCGACLRLASRSAQTWRNRYPASSNLGLCPRAG